MENLEETNNRLAKNTILLYIRMGVMMAISFFTARVTLEALGVTNYGIYNVVGGLVSMFSLISASLTASVTRFLTFGLGKGNITKLKKTFAITVNIQIALILAIFVFAETLGLWFVNTRLTIPEDRMFAANFVYQVSILTFSLSLFSIPFNAIITAHEKMSVYAYLTIGEAVFKLIIVIMLLYMGGDKLIIYSSLILCQSIISQSISYVYCRRKFEECRYALIRDYREYKEIFQFSGWNFIGSSAAILSNQGVNMILNIFFGPIVNTARGIGIQVTAMLTSFSNNFMTALNPQITKSFASNQLNRTYSLIMKGAKLSFFLFLILSAPFLIETHQALHIWLGQVPEYSVKFARLAIILSLINILSNTLITAQLATGKLKKYQIVVGGTMMLNLPLSYLFLKLGYAPTVTMIIAICIAQICMFLRLWFLREMIGLQMKIFLKTVYLKVILITVITLICPLIIYYQMNPTILRFICVGITCVVSSVGSSFYLGCNSNERAMILSQIKRVTSKF